MGNSSLASFDWQDPFFLEDQLTEEERMTKDSATAFAKGNLLMAAESPDNQMVRLAQNEFNFGRHIPIQSVIDNIDAVMPSDLITLAEDLWGGGRAALTMVGPGVDGTDFSGQLAL